jgi:hypothetical protein
MWELPNPIPNKDSPFFPLARRPRASWLGLVIYKPFDLDELLQAIHQFLPASSVDQREHLA